MPVPGQILASAVPTPKNRPKILPLFSLVFVLDSISVE